MTMRSTAVEAARLGAAELMRFRDHFAVREKAPKDLVTDADLASQRAVFNHLRDNHPEHLFVGEEEGQDRPPVNAAGQLCTDTPCWIVDPLDGTVNYVHQLQAFCVSIALWHHGKIQIGVVYDPLTDELFTAERGHGATLARGDGSNARTLRVSDCQTLDRALLACSFPAGVSKDALSVRQFCELIEVTRAVRRLGSCALNLCYVAAGRLDGYWASCVKAWDMAAGALIVEEAGGKISAFDGQPVDLWNPVFVAAGQSALHEQIRAKLAATPD